MVFIILWLYFFFLAVDFGGAAAAAQNELEGIDVGIGTPSGMKDPPSTAEPTERVEMSDSFDLDLSKFAGNS